MLFSCNTTFPFIFLDGAPDDHAAIDAAENDGNANSSCSWVIQLVCRFLRNRFSATTSRVSNLRCIILLQAASA